ncbi:TIGR02117 family protein [Neorhizobium galegae]|uniref:TIGR02117 family protein n=1 Tax=Neorhizobium galegae TaxID=399 RepID=UPI000622012D|nr:TIGR02117 family protein [Neorhizobium galegae]CDZ57585.1 Probable urease-associated protein [Neorhizobium galegae bv. orientalis]KAB1124397.1 TIGR02117 family protein [Neorhizobium galegae]MCQ1809484.1 TIGR02117 family protein [Neorhizobium galegae]MCQ1835907.1 TIGR02117 family protein [Neorhizobium galegae]UIY28521.1 TIGR02117 family protein [Neorhizobium galegae]
MKTFLRWLLAAALFVVVAVAAGTFIPRPLFAPSRAAEPAAQRRILVLSNPIHTDIAIPLAGDTRAAFAFLGRSGIPVADPGAEWLVLGWGGRAFYLETPTWADLKPLPVLRALTIDSSVMHVDVAGGIDESHPAVMPLDLEAAEFQRLLVFIQTSFIRQAGEVAVVPGAGYGDNDRFFEANGYFNAFAGCNTWAAAALRAAGLRTGLWNPLPQTLTLSLKLFN